MPSISPYSQSEPQTFQRAPWSLWLIALLHGIGAIGFVSGFPGFARLTPIHLLVVLALWSWHQPGLNRGLTIWLTACALGGYGVEVLGVHTGLIFGDYSYGAALGPRLFGVPLLIGINWMLLLGVTGSLSFQIGEGQSLAPAARAAVGATLMVLLDLPMEPFAMRYDLWGWASANVPLRNYAAWWGVSMGALWVYHQAKLGRPNKASAWVYCSQLLFFASVTAFGHSPR